LRQNSPPDSGGVARQRRGGYPQRHVLLQSIQPGFLKIGKPTALKGASTKTAATRQ
jgi:hypothetical protein